MREYILTEKEQKIVKCFLENGERLEGFAVLLSRCKRGLPKLEEQIKLAKEFIEAAER